jgi:hypothetical protein
VIKFHNFQYFLLKFTVNKCKKYYKILNNAQTIITYLIIYIMRNQSFRRLKGAKSLTTRPPIIKTICETLLSQQQNSAHINKRVISTLNLFEKVCNKSYRKLVNTKYLQLNQTKNIIRCDRNEKSKFH